MSDDLEPWSVYGALLSTLRFAVWLWDRRSTGRRKRKAAKG